MPLPYLSKSAFELYERDPIEYYKEYFVCRKNIQNDKMILGTIFQEAWCDKKYDYKKELKKAGFNSDSERAITTALNHHALTKLPKSKTEKKWTVQGLGLNYPILAIFDGLDEDIDLIVENKFGAPWNKKRIETEMFTDSNGQQQRDRQATWYALVYYIKKGKIPKFMLQSVNSRSGIPNKFYIKKTLKDLKELVMEINTMVERVTSGDFNKYN